MNKIKQIKLKHFKFFYGEVTIDLERQNALIFGENGSGKSSLYWALYTFLQSVFKDTPQKVQKYFQHNHDENLRNRFAPDADDSYIKVVFEDDHKSTSDKQISNSTVNTKTGPLIRQAVQGSELINYKLLSKIHDFKNPQQIDLFPIMDKEILPFINFRENLVRHDGVVGTANAQEWWDYIKPGMQPRGKMHELPYKTFAAAVTKFNSELQFYFDSIVESVNEYLEKFKQPFTVSFEIANCSYDAFVDASTTKRNHKTIAPNVFIHAHFNHAHIPAHKQKITRPHTFLNEAKLTAIALSIRLAMLGQKLSGAVVADTPKFLILDDVLISLDMSNREIVLDIILQEFTDYQLIILTHDRNFFELLRHRIKKFNQTNWKYIEMYECEKDGIPQPLIKTSETYLDKAEKYFQLKEYEISGNFLRKEAEAFCKEFLPKKWQHTVEYNLHDLNGLIKQLTLFAVGSGLDKQLFEDLDSHRKFVLNPTSHDSYDVPKFNSEVGNCLNTLKALRKIQNEPFLKRGEQVEFELSDGTDTYKFEIKLEDDFRLLKEPGKASVISKGMVNYWTTKNTDPKGGTQHGLENLNAFYDKIYNKSDKTKNPDFWEEVLITSSGQLLKTERKF
ncbi:MAG: AAA family ATPase [Bacteroidetes bacterium]|nr:AAA family ATPase [Bacteroidota bacterium]